MTFLEKPEQLNYTEIFNQRGKSYEQAMRKYPLARIQEFTNIVQLADLEHGLTVCDVPSGGGYLKDFMQHNTHLISIDTSKIFFELLNQDEQSQIIHCPNLAEIPLSSNSVDRIISLAGLHHVESRLNFYQEAYRLLKNNGLFCIADVKTGSGVADFLNIFVDRYSTTGHQGDFLTITDQQYLEKAGFQVTFSDVMQYHWSFDSIEDMTSYCRQLFGMDKAKDEEVLQGIETYLGYQLIENKCYMNWELLFLKAIKN